MTLKVQYFQVVKCYWVEPSIKVQRGWERLVKHDTQVSEIKKQNSADQRISFVSSARHNTMPWVAKM
jgi:hypothetical protein